jgi:hypothetical protein
MNSTFINYRSSKTGRDFRKWPVADARVAGPSVRNLIKFRRQSQAWLTVTGDATVARIRRPLPRKAAVAADMVWCL